jgi:broad specificity polyphosphatase/5'/3'-nucleotidase SurE
MPLNKRLKMPLKKTSNNNRVYFISNNADEELIKIKEALITDNISFIEKVYKSSINNNNNSTTFINININAELTEELFIKVSKKFNKILNKSYKMFYKDNKNKFVYVPEEIKEEINKSLSAFIKDD